MSGWGEIRAETSEIIWYGSPPRDDSVVSLPEVLTDSMVAAGVEALRNHLGAELDRWSGADDAAVRAVYRAILDAAHGDP